MSIAGTVVNGVIVLDGASRLPEGMRVRVEPAAEEADEVHPPIEPFDRDRELALLREALDDVKGGRGRPFDEVMDEIAKEYNLPHVDLE